MIVNFSVQNFGPIKEKQTLSFEADKSTHLESQYVIEAGGKRLLKLALIYGANASGKTTILKALDFLRDLVLAPKEKKTDELNFTPFLFDKEAPKQNSLLAIEFIQNDIRYFYEVEFFKKAIVAEQLDVYHPNKARVFTRTTNLENQFTQIEFGGKIKIDKASRKALELNTLWNNTVLGGYLKTNIEIKELREVKDWFDDYLMPLLYADALSNYFVKEFANQHEQRKNFIKLIRNADFNISNIRISEVRQGHHGENIDFNERTTKSSIEQAEKNISQEEDERLNIEFEHTVGSERYFLPLKLESDGTQKYSELLGYLIALISLPIVVLIDELEASLHPELFQHFLLTFLVNAKQSQLVATTHNREILGNRDLFRDDAIWITDKNEAGATQLYSLASFDSSVLRNSTNRLNAYKSGSLGGVPNPGDYYIDIEE